MLTLPLEDPLEHARLFQEWTDANPNSSPIERGYIEHAVNALIEKRRIERIRATVRTQKVRTAILNWERAQEDNVAYWLDKFNDHPPSALVGLLRSAAGCRWAIAYWNELASMLHSDGTWLGSYRVGAVQLLGQSACYDELYFYETAFLVSLDALACQASPKQRDIDLLLDPREIPPTLQGRDVPLWPRNPAECRARLQALVDRELPRLRALEETLRVLYEEPSKAEAQVMALASVTKEEMQLLRAEQIHQQSYQRAATALLNARKQTAAAREAAARARHESALLGCSIVITGQTPNEAVNPQVVGGTGSCNEFLTDCGGVHAVVGRSSHRAAGDRKVSFLSAVSRTVAGDGGAWRLAPNRVTTGQTPNEAVESQVFSEYGGNDEDLPGTGVTSRAGRPAVAQASTQICEPARTTL